MFFTRTQNYKCSLQTEDFKSRLIGNHVTIHQMDFEVYEKDQSLRIVPHAEQTNSLTTLPITKVDIKQDGCDMKITVTSKMRKLDSGGPQLVILFCAFLFIASFILLYVDGQPQITYTLLGAGAVILTTLWIRLEMGYFDYVRKIRHYVESRMAI
jgi:hypothetical protein